MAIGEVVQKKEAEVKMLTIRLAETKRLNLTRLMQLQQHVQSLKREMKQVRDQCASNNFSNLAPAQSQQQWINIIQLSSTQSLKQTEQSLTEKHTAQVQQLEVKVKEKQKQYDQQRMQTQEAQQDCLELKEQLNEYKGLTSQLTVEKHQLNEQVNAIQAKLDAQYNHLDAQNTQSNIIIESLNSQLMTSQKDLSESH